MLTSQFFLPDALSEFLYTQMPLYQRARLRDTLNSVDGIALKAGATVLGAVREERQRYVATLALVVDPAANPVTDQAERERRRSGLNPGRLPRLVGRRATGLPHRQVREHRRAAWRGPSESTSAASCAAGPLDNAASEARPQAAVRSRRCYEAARRLGRAPRESHGARGRSGKIPTSRRTPRGISRRIGPTMRRWPTCAP